MSEAPDLEVTRRFCLQMITFLSNAAMDPHRYFEQKWLAEVQALESSDELLQRLRQLVAWFDGADLGDIRRMQLDRELAAQGLPTIDSMRDAMKD